MSVTLYGDSMPKGIVVIKWDDRVGPVILAKHPEKIGFDMDLAMKVYTTHFAGSTPPFSVLDIGDWHIASYYLPKDKYLFALVLDPKNAETSMRISFSQLQVSPRNL